MKKNILLLLILIQFTAFGTEENLQHPFLIVTKDTYPDLREKLKDPFFKEIRDYCSTRWNSSNISISLYSSSLMYILSPHPWYKQRILSKLDQWANKVGELNHKEFAAYVPPAATQFYAIIALDIIYNDLSLEEKQESLANIDTVAQFYLNNPASWKLAEYGINLLYSIFKRDTLEINKWKTLYDERLFTYSLAEDNSWTSSSGYFHARMNSGRLAKNGIIDVMDFTGIGNYYKDIRVQEMFEWSTTFSLTPFGTYTALGETTVTTENRLGIARNFFFAEKYGDKISNQINWFLENEDIKKLPITTDPLFVYILRSSSISRNKKMPTSLLKRYSGAALWGKNNSKKALQGILYCLFDTITIHALEESNSLSISAYGQPMIVNSGTRYRTADGITSSYPGFTPNGNRWYYANYQNTVLIGGRTRHVQRSGAGLVDGIIGENIEFGTTNAGSALGNGEHERILYFIQPINNISNGYFIVSDLVKPTNTSDNIAINFQLNTMKGSTQQVVKNGEYYAPINGFVNDNHNGTEIVNLFFTSQPHIQIQESYKASKNNVIESDNLQANYSTNLNGELRANTIIFPEDKNHKKPFIQKINGENYDGALLKHNDKFIDVFLGTDGSIGNYGDVDFNAETVFFRKENNNISSYSITKGTHFFERKRHIGFSSSSDISITMEDNKGIVNTFSDTYVTFYKKNISEVFLDTVKPKLFSDLNNSIAPNTSELTETPKNAIRILIPKGRHSINITDLFGNEDGSIIHRIIPNPVKDGVFHLDFSDNFVSQKGELIITDIKGKLIKSKQLEETLFDRKRVFTVNVEGVEKGIYFIRLISTGGLMVYSDTFIIE